MSIKKAIFVVAGFGTRFLPITKSVPKEMLPIVDKPIIQYLVEEAVECGIEDIIFVTGRGKHSIENHFDKSYELEQTLVEKNKNGLLEEVEKISRRLSGTEVCFQRCQSPAVDPWPSPRAGSVALLRQAAEVHRWESELLEDGQAAASTEPAAIRGRG